MANCCGVPMMIILFIFVIVMIMILQQHFIILLIIVQKAQELRESRIFFWGVEIQMLWFNYEPRNILEVKRLMTSHKLVLALVYFNMQINLRCVSPVRSLAFLWKLINNVLFIRNLQSLTEHDWLINRRSLSVLPLLGLEIGEFRPV